VTEAEQRTKAFADTLADITRSRRVVYEAAEQFENDHGGAHLMWGHVDAYDALLGFMNGDPRFTGVSSAPAPTTPLLAEPLKDRTEDEGPVIAAAGYFAEVWSELPPSLPDSYGCEMSCSEADVAADLYRALGDEATADAIITAHAEHDVDGDAHWTSGPVPAEDLTEEEGAS
jgi:hypothetical protein